MFFLTSIPKPQDIRLKSNALKVANIYPFRDQKNEVVESEWFVSLKKPHQKNQNKGRDPGPLFPKSHPELP